MTNQELLKIIKEKDQIVVWGHTCLGDYLYDFISNNHTSAKLCMCDNDHNKQGIFNNNKIVSSTEAIKEFPSAIYVLTSYNCQNIMRQELINAGVPNENIIYGVTKEAEAFSEKQMREKKRKKLDKLQFEIDVAMHCNLDCNCCSQFAPIANPEFVDIEVMERDFKRLSELFHGEAKRIYLIGGEPLLNTQIVRCMSIARNSFPNATISVFTNGILLNKQHEDFWEECRNDNIGIIVTRYPLKIDYDDLKSIVLEHGVSFELFGTSEDFKYMSNIGLDINGNQNADESFDLCWEANDCIKLKNGRLYTCTRPAAIYKFNQYFGKNLEVCEEDSIDIYKAKDKEEILNFLSSPIPFCKYCNNKNHHVAREWSHSKKIMEEWT